MATGGTARATAALVRRLGGTVHAIAFLIELAALNGRSQLTDENVFSVLKYRYRSLRAGRPWTQIPQMRNNGLSLALLALFLVCWLGQAVAGLNHYNDERSQHGHTTVRFSQYLRTSDFWEATFENWESEFLQMAVFVLLTAFLFQRGSAESKDPTTRSSRRGPKDMSATGRTVAGQAWRLVLRLYENSLGACIGPSVSRVLRWPRGRRRAALQRGAGAPRPTGRSLLEYRQAASSGSSRFRTGRASSCRIGALVVLTIFLRQRGSPESKPVYAPHSEMGRS